MPSTLGKLTETQTSNSASTACVLQQNWTISGVCFSQMYTDGLLIVSSDGYDFAPIFGTRLQQSFKHEPEIAKRLPKRTEQPDRVLGLRQTNMLKKLLRTSRYKSSISPYPLLDSPLLFPFLILESKSGKSTSDNHEIFMQTAFPIRRLLQLQKDLYALASSPAESSCPLVWFIFNRGGVWTVCACYVEGIGRNFRTVSFFASCDI